MKKNTKWVMLLLCLISLAAFASPPYEHNWSVNANTTVQAFPMPPFKHFCEVMVTNNGPGNVSVYARNFVDCPSIAAGATCTSQITLPPDVFISIHYDPASTGGAGAQGVINFVPY